MQKKILRFSLFFISLVAAFFSWYSVSRAITVADSSDWIVPMLWFSFFYVVYSLQFILVSEKLWPTISIFLGIFLSMLFAPNIWHFLILLLSAIFLYIAYLQIRKDLELNVKISLLKSLRMGKTFFMLALALVISGQYFFQAKAQGLMKPPVLDASLVLENRWAKAIIYQFNPSLKILEDKDLTVDEFILENLKNNQSESGEADLLDLVEDSRAIAPLQLQKLEELRKQKILESGREQLGKMANQKLDGSEKVAEVISASINYQIQSLVTPDYSNEAFPAIPLGMAFILFLTILSLGSFLARMLVHLARFIFWLFTAYNIVTIKKVPVEMEVIE